MKARQAGESDSDSDEKDTMSEGGKDDKSTSKPVAKSTVTDTCLLIPEIVESSQVEFDDHHRAKLGGVMEIQQSIVVGQHDATDKFGQTQVQTQLSAYLEKAKALASGTGKTTLSADKVMKGLNYTIPMKDPACNVQSTSK